VPVESTVGPLPPPPATPRLSRSRHPSGFILPEDLLRRLLVRLGPSRYVQLAAVCRTWEHISSCISPRITLRKSESLAGSRYEAFTARTMQGCCLRFRSLRELSLSDSDRRGADFAPDLFSVLPAILSQSNCSRLTAVRFSRCCLNDAQLFAIVSVLPSLNCLGINRCPHLTGPATIALPCIPQLTEIGLVALAATSNKTVQAIVQQAPRLERLDISGCQTLSLRCFSEDWCGLLSVAATSCDWLDDRAVAALARGCGSVRALDLSHCDAITDKGVIDLATQLPGLTKINLSWCTNVSGKSLDQLVATCSALSELRLEGCPRIGAKEILDLSASAVGAGVMSSICVARCPRVTDMAVAALGKRCKALKQLDVSHCPRVSEAGILDMMNNANLQCITARGVQIDTVLLKKHLIPGRKQPDLLLS